MALIDGSTISIPTERRSARRLLSQMADLLAQRRQRWLTRRQFLERWSGLRKRLLLTRDYQDLRQRVSNRAGGACELCGAKGTQLHHVERVVDRLDLVLTDDNCRWVCRDCHEIVDPCLVGAV